LRRLERNDELGRPCELLSFGLLDPIFSSTRSSIELFFFHR
jgi:hypothetical protein